MEVSIGTKKKSKKIDCDLFFMLLDKYATFCVTQMEVCGHGKQPEETETNIHSPAEI